MAATTNFFTLAAMERLSIFSVTSEAANREGEFAFDLNLDTWWEPTGSTSEIIILDLGSLLDVNLLILFVRNFDADLGNSVLANISFSHGPGTGGPWTGTNTLTINDKQTLGEPIMLQTDFTTENKRYWRIIAGLMVPVIQFSGLFICRKRTITTDSLFPADDAQRFATKLLPGHGGRSMRLRHNRQLVKSFSRTWQIIGDTDKDTLDAIITESVGRHLPLIIQEDSGTPEVVEITDVRFDQNKQQYQIYRPTITFRTLPFMGAGEVF